MVVSVIVARCSGIAMYGAKERRRKLAALDEIKTIVGKCYPHTSTNHSHYPNKAHLIYHTCTFGRVVKASASGADS